MASLLRFFEVIYSCTSKLTYASVVDLSLLLWYGLYHSGTDSSVFEAIYYILADASLVGWSLLQLLWSGHLFQDFQQLFLISNSSVGEDWSVHTLASVIHFDVMLAILQLLWNRLDCGMNCHIIGPLQIQQQRVYSKIVFFIQPITPKCPVYYQTSDRWHCLKTFCTPTNIHSDQSKVAKKIALRSFKFIGSGNSSLFYGPRFCGLL